VAERLGRLGVDHQLEIGRLLDRHIGGLGTAQELDELPSEPLSKDSDDARAICKQAAISGHWYTAGNRRVAARSMMIRRWAKRSGDASQLNSKVYPAAVARNCGLGRFECLSLKTDVHRVD
jgi:hypothetical protein